MSKSRDTIDPGRVLTKQTPDDYGEAYLEVFERTAIREKWPEDELGALLAPFLTGEAQRACQDLPAKDAADYAKLKRAILFHYGHSLPARAQHLHVWIFDPTQPVRPQIDTTDRGPGLLQGKAPQWCK